ncbi:MAG: hypothetical protein ACYCQK_04400 [Acidiferrobacteraceae bacterium]
MSTQIKPLILALAATFVAAAWVPAQAAATKPMARETHSDVAKDRMDIHKDLVALHKAYAARAKDRHALVVARHAHNKAGASKALAAIKSDNTKIAKLQADLRHDRADLKKDEHTTAAKPAAK